MLLITAGAAATRRSSATADPRHSPTRSRRRWRSPPSSSRSASPRSSWRSAYRSWLLTDDDEVQDDVGDRAIARADVVHDEVVRPGARSSPARKRRDLARPAPDRAAAHRRRAVDPRRAVAGRAAGRRRHDPRHRSWSSRSCLLVEVDRNGTLVAEAGGWPGPVGHHAGRRPVRRDPRSSSPRSCCSPCSSTRSASRAPSATTSASSPSTWCSPPASPPRSSPATCSTCSWRSR